MNGYWSGVASYYLYLVGGIGPDGGYVFYDKGFYSEGWRYLETASIYIFANFGYYRYSHEGANHIVGTSPFIGSRKSNTTALVNAMGTNACVSSTSSYTKANYAARE